MVEAPTITAGWTIRKRLVALAVATAVAVAVSILTVEAAHNAARHRQDLIAHGSRSHARVLEASPQKSFTQVTVAILDGDAVGWEVRTSLSNETELFPGAVVDVAYDPEDPGDLVIIGERESRADPFIDFVAWMIVITIGYFALTPHRRPLDSAASPRHHVALQPHDDHLDQRRLLPHPRVEIERDRRADLDVLEVRMSGVEYEVRFLSDDHRRHLQHRAPRCLNPGCSDGFGRSRCWLSAPIRWE